MSGSKNRYYSVIGYRNEGEHILVENVTFEKAMKVFDSRSHQFETINILEEHRVDSKPKNLFVIASAEGMLQETIELLERPLKLKETFLFLGNYVADAPGFCLYLNLLSETSKKRRCVFVKGANEHNILEKINGTREYVGDAKQRTKMFRSIEKELSFPLREFPKKFPELYKVLSSSLDYYENDAYIFVPGGLDLTIEYWKQTPNKTLLYTDEEFLLSKNEIGKRIVFGDAPVTLLNKSGRIRPWINGAQDKIGINGGCRQGGKLYGMSILDGNYSFLGIRSKSGREERMKEREAKRDAEWQAML